MYVELKDIKKEVKCNTEQLHRIEKEVAMHEEVILRRVK